MARWLISAPAWGEAAVEVFCASALPALERAMVFFKSARGDFGDEAVLVVHTDQPDRVVGAASQIRVEPRPVPVGLRDFDCLSQAHREVLAMAVRGDAVVLLTADLVISELGLAYCARVFEDDPQKYMVACAGVRALREGRLPDTRDAPGLMAWAWANRHPMTEDCIWPTGRSTDLSRIYFEKDGSVVARLALPHPLAVKIDGRPLRFAPTVDANLIQCFDITEIHVVRDPGQLALVELSPRYKPYDVSLPQMGNRPAFHVPDPLQRALMQRVLLVGEDQDCGDGEVMAQVGRAAI